MRDFAFVFLKCSDLFSVCSATYGLKLIHRTWETLQCESNHTIPANGLAGGKYMIG